MSSGGGRRKRGGHEEEHENHERWLVTYADMLTVLMALFIVMFAISQVDQTKFEKLRASLAGALGQESVAFEAQGKALAGEAASNAPDPAEMQPTVGEPPTDAEKEKARKAVADADRRRASERAQKAEAEVESFEKLQKAIEEALKRNNAQDAVKFRIDERGLVVTVVTDEVVFGNASAELQAKGRRIVDAIAPPLKTKTNRIQVDGHTNHLPMVSGLYPSNWELSTARASTVVRRLMQAGRLPAGRLSAAGYAEQRPLYPVSDSRSLRLNRRVEIAVLSDLPAEVRALLPSAAGQAASSGTSTSTATTTSSTSH
ncbi:OmpA/MotB family protein [Spirillospora albida]|uniref:OmpA/MotB family protein n=1 Tax=Spirillospora albida TaxID=58123 RepID=UPI0004C19EC6|nr:flagellar motor protein MotB [Spirillospora albida]